MTTQPPPTNHPLSATQQAMPKSQADAVWKQVLERWFQPFLECFWPNIAHQIDWQQSIEELSQEMQPFMTTALTGKRIVDKLYKVPTRGGKHAMVLTHIEIQGGKEAAFEKRLFEYGYKIYDRYQLPLVTLVVLSDDHKQWRPQSFEMEAFGYMTMCYQFQSVKLLDWEGQEAQLLDSRNPFENLIAIYLAARNTHHQPHRRLQVKRAIFDHLVRNAWGREDMVSFYTFLDGILRLPKDLELQYHEHILAIEREKNMNYVSSAEQIGIEKGMQAGMQAGMKAGMKAGIEQSNRKHILKMKARNYANHEIAEIMDLSEAEVMQVLEEVTH
jgi:hypothetical protein